MRVYSSTMRSPLGKSWSCERKRASLHSPQMERGPGESMDLRNQQQQTREGAKRGEADPERGSQLYSNEEHRQRSMLSAGQTRAKDLDLPLPPPPLLCTHTRPLGREIQKSELPPNQGYIARTWNTGYCSKLISIFGSTSHVLQEAGPLSSCDSAVSHLSLSPVP